MMDRFIIQWHITHLCNLRCKHCYQEEYNQHIQKDNFYLILNKLTDYLENKEFLPQINLTGGEPLLHPNFFEFAQEIKNRNIKLGILTNGTLIDDEVAKKISELKPVMVQISLDGTEKTHDEIRGIGNFQKALQGIDYLKKYNVKVLVSFTAQKNNYQDFAELAKICKKHHVDKLWWDRVVTDDEQLFLTTDEFKELVQSCNKLIHNHNPFINYSFVSNQRSLQYVGVDDCTYNCSAGKSLIVILADGNVMPCRRLPFIVGNLLESTLDEIYTHSTMKQLREFIAPQECLNCNHYMKCKGGARCVTYAQLGSLIIKDVNCFYKS